MDLFKFIPGYETAIFNSGREPAFIMLLSFLLTYVMTRGYTRLARKTGWGSASFGGVHTHHMVFGVIIAFVSGALMFALLPEQPQIVLLFAALFGCGVALVLDEYALLFHLKDVYWEKEGRKSIDAVVLGLAFGSIFLLQITPLGIDGSQPIKIAIVGAAFNLAFVVIAALKGKIYLATFGVFLPFIALIGAGRLAEPGSIWAKKLYASKPNKYKRAKARYAAYNKKWKARKEKLWDFIGGATGRPNR